MLKLGIAGLGHVGCGLIKLVEQQAQLRLPGHVEIAGVTARHRGRDRAVDISPYTWFDSPEALAVSDDIDVFVELMGGSEGSAKAAIELALKAGRPVITANKALIAEHGMALNQLAEEAGVNLLFEAAVAGGVPIVRTLRDSLSGISVSRVSGILNGTCNFLTSEMLASKRSFETVLGEAQALGYAEADPTLDISGADAAHKIAILSAIAFSADLDFSKVHISGVESISLQDLVFADRLGLTLKLIAEGVLTGDSVVCRVEPKALAHAHPLARINGSLNTVRVEGDPLGAVTLTGPGAGAGPTASAVMGDVSKLFGPNIRSPFGRASHHKRRLFSAERDEEISRWLLRVELADRSGSLAILSNSLAKSQVSIDKLLQDSANSEGYAPVAIVTHPCSRKDLLAASTHLAEQDAIIGDPHYIRIESDT